MECSSRVGSRRVSSQSSLSSSNWPDVLEPTLVAFGAVAARRHVDLRVERPIDGRILAGCAPELRQALDNIIANALKFTPRGGFDAPPGLGMTQRARALREEASYSR